ncbi:putative disease resistance protein At1g50180 [Silene latifolia]|uniref:putative disease resistance protein At1g50180 n=1 Tax=Silene latifolia TaxID=37657 RepID=UPI003D771069
MAASDVASAVQLIGTLLIQEVNSLYGVETQIKGLQEELEFMQQYLHDADARQEDREIGALVRQVRKLAYDAEDVIDTYILKVRQSNGNRLMKFAYLMYKFPQIYEVREQIQIVQTSLKRVSEKLNSHGVRKIINLQRSHVSFEDGYRRQRPRSYPYEDSEGEFVVGMEEDIRKLVDMVMGEGRTQVNVVLIAGMGGSGKTTLARKIYNHPYAKECFDCSAWVFISQEWSTQHILSEILRKVCGPEQTMTKLQNTLSVEELVDKLRFILQKKSYLVVLDDVWSREVLEEILPALPRGGSINKGSKIIITTRNREIIQFRVSHQKYLYIHEPRPLTGESSWELFSKIALGHRKNFDAESFKSVGKDMLRKCDGLPLAIVALAGILNTRSTIGEWQGVAEAVRSRIMDGRCENVYGRVGELLALSYDDLPYDLKACFLYLGVFPEDYQIPVGILTRMWIAEGLISTQYRDMPLEDVALQRVEELSHRFMIQVVRTNYKGVIKAIRLHDLLRDLSVQKAKEQSFLQIYTPNNSDSAHMSTLAIQPRRAAVHASTALPTHISHLRSLILLTRSSISHSSYNCEEELNFGYVSQNFKLLRVLSIWGIKIVSGILPNQIGCLVHLRYLAIRETNIIVLPSTIGSLRNLLTLDYRDIDLENKVQKENVKIELPDIFQGLVLLRHLFLPIECPWSVKELNLGNMRNLQTLWGLNMMNNFCFLREVPKLSSCLKKLKIVVSREEELKAAFRCPSLMADVLHTFHCDLRHGLALCDVEPLHSRQHLLKVTLIGEIQMRLALVLPINLVRLELRDSVIEDASFLEALGTLAHLKRLYLSNAYVGTKLSCMVGSFPQLEELNVESLPILTTWTIEKGAMPSLKKLEISRCWCLKNFPEGLPLVTTLEQLEFFDMPDSFNSQATKYGWTPLKLRLPHNFASIIKLSDSPVDSSSIQKLYEQLIIGIFLDNKTMKYWVTKKDGSYINSFMVYVRGLWVCSGCLLKARLGTRDIQKRLKVTEHCPYVEIKEVIESLEDGTMVTVAKIKSLISSRYTHVIGKFDLENLSMEVKYEIDWIIMFQEPEHSENSKKPGRIFVDEVDGETKIKTQLNGKEMYEEVIHGNYGKRLNEWIRIPGGEFETHPSMEEQMELSLSFAEGMNPFELIIKGFIIRPKL